MILILEGKSHVVRSAYPVEGSQKTRHCYLLTGRERQKILIFAGCPFIDGPLYVAIELQI